MAVTRLWWCLRSMPDSRLLIELIDTCDKECARNPVGNFPALFVASSSSAGAQCNAICQQCREVVPNLKTQRNFAKSKSSEGQHHQNVWLNLRAQQHTHTHAPCYMPPGCRVNTCKELAPAGSRRPKSFFLVVVVAS